MREIAAAVAADWGNCHFLVNGAGGNNINAMTTLTQFDPRELDNALADDERGFLGLSMEAFESVLKINTLGTVIPSRVFGAQMARSGGYRRGTSPVEGCRCPLGKHSIWEFHT